MSTLSEFYRLQAQEMSGALDDAKSAWAAEKRLSAYTLKDEFGYEVNLSQAIYDSPSLRKDIEELLYMIGVAK